MSQLHHVSRQHHGDVVAHRRTAGRADAVHRRANGGVPRTTGTDRCISPCSGRNSRSLGGQRTATYGSTLAGRPPPIWGEDS